MNQAECHHCAGKGYVVVYSHEEENVYEDICETCIKCGGTGVESD
jgi:DnaJ-class molecular chaperone